VDEVLLRTVDNFQGTFPSRFPLRILIVPTGEEADIVLLSLVRNPGEGKSGSIGFLKVSTFQSPFDCVDHICPVIQSGERSLDSCPTWHVRLRECRDPSSKERHVETSCTRV
jgi:hypothetical protein